MNVGSLFSGIGGFDLGLERAGMTVAWQCEIDTDAEAVLGKHWPTVTCYPNVRYVDASAPRVDVLCGGFPCQDLSVAGKRAGLAGERSRLFYEFCRVANELTPRWVLIENVPGLLSSGQEVGNDMGQVLGTLADLGYGWAYRVLDAQYFGVAQRRRRVFIVGCLGDSPGAAEVLFEPESGGGDSPPLREAGEGPAGNFAVSTLQGGGDRGYRIDAEGAAGGQLIAFSHTQGLDPQVSETAWPTLRAEGGGHAVAFSENQRAEVLETEYAHQLTTGGGKPGQGYAAVREGMSVRRLTPRECERLQGFPDGWTECLSDAARYRTLGNAVAVPVVEWIGKRMVRG